MINLYSKNEFLNIHDDSKVLNEGLFNFIGKLFNTISTYIKKIKGGQEIQDIYNKYLKKINDDIKKKVQVDFSLTAEDQLKTTTTTTTAAVTTTVTTTVSPSTTTVTTTLPATTEVKKESLSVKVHLKNILNEADVSTAINTVKNTVNQAKSSISPNQDTKEAGTNVKLTIAALKGKANLIQQIIDTNAEVARNEMNRVLSKYGGQAKNPKLAIIIGNKIDEFKLAFLNAKIKIYDAGGDKTSSLAVAKNRDILSKQLDEKWKNLSKEQNTQTTDLKIGDTVKFHSDSLNKDVEEKIIKIDGDTLTFNSDKGEFTKKKTDVTKIQPIVNNNEKQTDKNTEIPVEKPAENQQSNFKAGDKISWTPNGDSKEIIRTITKVDGDKLTFKEGDKPDGRDMTKKSSDVKKIEAKPASAQVQTTKPEQSKPTSTTY